LISIVATGSPENIFARTIAALSANQVSLPHPLAKAAKG
jgi:hypothetical protein